MMMATAISYPLENRPTLHATIIYYRERAKTWHERAAALPDSDPQQAVYREIAEGYEKIAACYERSGQFGGGSSVAVREAFV